MLGAFAALVYAGVTIANVFSASGDAARDTGVFRSITAWATPLGLFGVATLFAAAIPLSLAQIRTGIQERRNALSTALPQLLHHR
ncbi:MAG TPA: hypothetical protein VMX12_12930 [Acidimicrobiia bacterium]|nr:hypothetical protein [Acidimicrobiia bacterium]